MDAKRIEIIPEFTGYKGDVKVSFINSSFITADGIKFKYPDREFGPWLIDQLKTSQKIFANVTGVLNKKYVCPHCNIKLSTVSPAYEWETILLKYKELPQFILKIYFPWIECLNCKKKCCVDSNGIMSFYLNEALISAFHSQNINP